MARKKAERKDKIKLENFVLENHNKFNRAVFGTMSSKGKLDGGVGENATDLAVLAEYDRLGGLITKDGTKVKTGSFYDFDARKPREKPQLVYLYRGLEGYVEVPEGKELPKEAKAVLFEKQVREEKEGKK